MLYKALDQVLQWQSDWIIETTKVGIVNNALSCLRGVDTKAAFAEALVRGLGGNLNYER